MVQRTGTWRRKARHILKKSIRRRGKVPVSRLFATFDPGQRVLLHAEPAYHKGMYHLRHHGKSGIIQGKRGGCYLVDVQDGGKTKQLMVHPVHLRGQ